MATGAALTASARLPQEETERGGGGEKVRCRPELPVNEPFFSSSTRIHLLSSPRAAAAAETLSAPNPPTGTDTRLKMCFVSPFFRKQVVIFGISHAKKIK